MTVRPVGATDPTYPFLRWDGQSVVADVTHIGIAHCGGCGATFTAVSSSEANVESSIRRKYRAHLSSCPVDSAMAQDA